MTLGGVYLIKTLFPCLTKCLSLGQTFQTCVSGFTARYSASSLPNVWFLLFQIWFIKMAIFSSARSSYCHPDLLLGHQLRFFRSPVLNNNLETTLVEVGTTFWLLSDYKRAAYMVFFASAALISGTFTLLCAIFPEQMRLCNRSRFWHLSLSNSRYECLLQWLWILSWFSKHNFSSLWFGWLVNNNLKEIELAERVWIRYWG